MRKGARYGAHKGYIAADEVRQGGRWPGLALWTCELHPDLLEGAGMGAKRAEH